MFPTVALVAEFAAEGFGMGAAAAAGRPGAVASGQVLHAHQLLEVLFEAGLVGELPEAVGTPQGAVDPGVVRRLQVVVEKPLLGKVLGALGTPEGPLSGVHPAKTKQIVKVAI